MTTKQKLDKGGKDILQTSVEILNFIRNDQRDIIDSYNFCKAHDMTKDAETYWTIYQNLGDAYTLIDRNARHLINSIQIGNDDEDDK